MADSQPAQGAVGDCSQEKQELGDADTRANDRDWKRKANLFQSLIGRLPALGTFKRGVLALSSGTAAGQLIIVVASPVLTRLYGPADFGILAVFIALLATLTVVASLRLEFAIPLPLEDGDAANLAAGAMIALVVVVGMLGLATGLRGESLAVLLRVPEVAPFLWLLPLGILAAGLYNIFNYWAIRGRAYGKIARTYLYKGGGATVTQIGFAWITAGPLGLLVGDVIGRSAGTVTLGKAAWQSDRQLIGSVAWSRIATQITRYRRFPLISTGASLLNSAGLQVPALLLAGLYGPYAAGLYALAHRVAGAPMRLIGRSVAQVFVGHGAKLVREKDPAVLHLFSRTARKLLVVGFFPVIAVAVGGPWLFGSIFGLEWAQSGEFVRLLALMYLVQFVVAPLSQTLNMVERQDLQLFWDALRLVGAAGSIGVAAYLGATVHVAIGSYAAVMAAAYLLLLFLAWRTLTRRAKVWIAEGK